MIKRWIENIIIETIFNNSLVESRLAMPKVFYSNRNPTSQDTNYNHQTIWENSKSGEKFICYLKWHKIEEEGKK